MAQILIRNLSDDAVQRLKERAKRHRRSLEAEVRDILEGEAGRGEDAREAAFRFAADMRRRLEGRISGDSADLIREDRDRR